MRRPNPHCLIWKIPLDLHGHRDLPKLTSQQQMFLVDELAMFSTPTEAAHAFEERFGIDAGEIDPRVFWRVTEDWLELTVRFLGPDHGIRDIKDSMTRDILAGFEKARIMIAAARQEAVTTPPARRTRAKR